MWDDATKSYTVAPSDRQDAMGKLRQLAEAGDAQGFTTFWDALDETVRQVLHSMVRSIPHRPEIATERRQPAPPAREQPSAGTEQPPAPAARPRATVTLHPAEVEKPAVVKEAPLPTRQTLRMTPQHYRNVVNAQGQAAAQALLEKATIRHAKTRRRLGQVTGATEDGKVTVSYRSKKKPMTVEELLGKHHVEVPDVRVGEKGQSIKLPPKTKRQSVIDQIRRHFKSGKRKAVMLKPLGFSDDEIATLERAGMAEGGSMDAAEFGRYDASQRGATPPPTGREPVARAAGRSPPRGAVHRRGASCPREGSVREG